MTEKECWNPRQYLTLKDIRTELDRFEAAQAAGTLRTTGDWSAGQILDHCGRWIKGSIDGIDFRIPIVLRVLGRLIVKPLLGRLKMKPGVKQPSNALTDMDPQPGVSFEEGLALMRTQLDRIDAGAQMTSDSPLLGKMTHEQWVKLHLDHCRLHFGFIKCE